MFHCRPPLTHQLMCGAGPDQMLPPAQETAPAASQTCAAAVLRSQARSACWVVTLRAAVPHARHSSPLLLCVVWCFFRVGEGRAGVLQATRVMVAQQCGCGKGAQRSGGP